jgi:phytoene dehydrogenase-like protein
VIVGSGINSLVCAALLARRGWRAVVLEAAEVLGGAVRSAELTVPGFSHDVFSAWHPLFVVSTAYAELRTALERRGLEYRCAEAVTASVFPDHSSRLLTRSRRQNIAELGVDGSAFAGDRDDFDAVGSAAMGLLGNEVLSAATARVALRAWRRHGGRGALALAAGLAESSRAWIGRTFAEPATGGLLAPWVLHTGLGPDAAGSGYLNRAIVALLEGVGLPVPAGGAGRLVEALSAVIDDHGGTCRTGCDVERVLVRAGRACGVRLTSGEEVGASRAVVCNVPPPALYGRLLADAPVPAWAREAAARFRFGRAGMQIHYALSSPPRWQDERLASVPIVHVTGGLDAVSRAVSEADRRLLPAEATVVCGQPCAADPGRAPAGASILWIQLQELPAHPIGDAAGELDVGDGTWSESLRERYADRIQARLAHHLEGFESSILGRRVLSPADIEAANPNLVGGDIYAGACDLDQSLLFRPRPELSGHATPIEALYEIGASTHPGPGLGAGSGIMVAEHLLRGEARPSALGRARRAAASAGSSGSRLYALARRASQRGG